MNVKKKSPIEINMNINRHRGYHKKESYFRKKVEAKNNRISFILKTPFSRTFLTMSFNN